MINTSSKQVAHEDDDDEMKDETEQHAKPKFTPWVEK